MNRVRRAPVARTPLVWLFAVGVCLIAATQEPKMQAPAVDVPAAVIEAIARDGAAPLIVGVRGSFVPEGYLSNQDAVAAQRAAMHAAVDGAMGRAAAVGALLGARFEFIPFFTAQVNAGALAALASMAEVVSIQLDTPQRPLLAQSVPLINAPAAWAAGHTGAGWSVVVLDTGIERTHSFLAGKVTAEACYSNAAGAGYGTSLCPGGVTSSTAPGSGAPCTGIRSCDHGTHVAGIATGANGPSGLQGVAPGASLISMQVFTRLEDFFGPYVASFTSDQIRGLERTLALAGPANANRIASVNMSMGGGGPFATACDTAQAALKAAIDNLLSLGIPTVISSGNSRFTTGVSSPACISTAVAVGSTTKIPEAISSFSNRSASMVDLVAPGSSIVSAVTGNGFGSKSGTSMSAPHVAGAWAVLKQALPGASVAQALAALRTSGTVINDPPSAAPYRRINVNAARLTLLGEGPPRPGPPGTPTIGGAGNTVLISWTAPTTGGTPAGYTLLARAGGPSGTAVAQVNVGNTLSVTVPVPNGTFHVTVRAFNESGDGPESAGVTFSLPVVPTPPGAPTNLRASVVNNQVTFSWTPPTTGGPPTSYILRAALTPGGPAMTTVPVAAPGSGITVSAPAGTFYVQIAAVNPGGVSPFSNEVQVVVAPPGPPTLNPATVVGTQVTLSWTAPATGNVPTSYRVVASLTSGGPAVASINVASGTSLTVNAPRGTFFVRVHGVNGLGLGAGSNEITVVVP